MNTKNTRLFLIGSAFFFLLMAFLGFWTNYSALADKSQETADPAGQPAEYSQSPVNPGDSSQPDLAIEPAAAKARAELAARLGVEAKSILILSVESAEWSDSCLGLGGPAESCAFMITPGYKVVLEAGGEAYVYRTDLTGNAVRPE